jgi:hypothetical protein
VGRLYVIHPGDIMLVKNRVINEEKQQKKSKEAVSIELNLKFNYIQFEA